MTPTEIATALLAARKGGAAFAPGATPPDLATAYAVQDQVAKALGGVAGWKGGPVDPAATRCSAIVAGGVVRSPATYDGGSFRAIGVEGEIAFVLAKGFPKGATPGDAEVLDAVASAHIAIEVCDTRMEPWRDVDMLWKIADFQANRGLVLGDAVADWRTRELVAQKASVTADGKEIGGRVGPGPTGDPRAVLCAMVRHLCSARDGVAAGAAMTTGSWSGLELVKKGARVVATFDGLGSAEVQF